MSKYTSQLAAITKAAFPNISEKDIKAFAYSKTEKSLIN
jgi:hypothetical protein